MSKRILLVDDELHTIRLLQPRLATNGYDVIVAVDGQEGLKKAREEGPDLILLDLMLPKIDGYKICRMLKFDESYKHIPVIIFTARAQEEDERLAFEVGADAYITKPFKPEELLEKIGELTKE